MLSRRRFIDGLKAAAAKLQHKSSKMQFGRFFFLGKMFETRCLGFGIRGINKHKEEEA